MPEENKPKKFRVSFLGIIFTVVLSIVIILLGERIIADLNKQFNPIGEYKGSDYDQRFDNRFETPRCMGAVCEEEAQSEEVRKEMAEMDKMSSDWSGLTGARLYYTAEQEPEYRLYKLLIHASFILPVFILMFLLYYWVNLKKRSFNWRVVVWGYMTATVWMLLHLAIETGGYMVERYKNAAVYMILVFLAAILTGMAVFIQKKRVEDAD